MVAHYEKADLEQVAALHQGHGHILLRDHPPVLVGRQQQRCRRRQAQQGLHRLQDMASEISARHQGRARNLVLASTPCTTWKRGLCWQSVCL